MSITVPFPRETDLEKLITSIRELASGRSNAHGEFTLTANDTSTVVTAVTCGKDATVLLQPMTANAAAEVAAGTIYVGTVANGSFTVTHANDASEDRTFRYVAIG